MIGGLERIVPIRRGASIGIGIIVVIVVIVVIVDLVFLPASAPVVAVVGCTLAAALVWSRGTRWFSSDARRQRMLARRGLCPRCGYDLRGGGADAGGGELCPECGEPIPVFLRPASYAWDRLKLR
jgi:hypothetical protein